MHSNRIRTARSLTVFPGSLLPDGGDPWWSGMTTVGGWWPQFGVASVAGGWWPQLGGDLSWGGGRCLLPPPQSDQALTPPLPSHQLPPPLWPCHLSHDAFNVTLPPPHPHPNIEQTDACENIAFARFAMPAIKNTFIISQMVSRRSIGELINQNRVTIFRFTIKF